MKWSAPSVVVPIGTRFGAVQLVPVVEVLMTMSLLEQWERKRQSCQATYTLPPPSISALESGLVRTCGGLCASAAATRTGLRQVAPPLVERKAMIFVWLQLLAGTITVPPGLTTGWPPSPLARLAVFFARPQVKPPLVEVETLSRLPCPTSSKVV